MKKIITFFFFMGCILSSYGQDCTNCFDDGPAGCGKQGYYDGDGDGFGTGNLQCFYGNPSYYAKKGGDCNDNNSSVFPRKFFADSDGDGYGIQSATTFCQGPNPPTGYASNNSDCDDSTSAITVEKNWYADVDSDNFGDSATASFGCTAPNGMTNPVPVGGDYDDSTDLITNVPPQTYYYDGDSDNYGIASNTKYQSFQPTDYVPDSGDCDDTKDWIHPETIWYFDSDGDGLGASSQLNKVQCTKPIGAYVLSNNDLCPDENGPQGNNGCTLQNPIVANDNDRNWVWSISYDADGNIKGNGISYFDRLGRPSQNQSVDIATAKIWTDQTLYDQAGRLAINTMSAPIGAAASFEYKDDFIRNASAQPYSSADFDTDPENPAVVGQQSNSLGWYYSDQNTDSYHEGNDYQDITDRPYSKMVYGTFSPDAPLRTVGGNKVDTNEDGNVDDWVQSYTFSMRASQELSKNVAFGNTDYDDYKIKKTVGRNVHGVENVIFSDTDGKVLAVARSGGSATPRSMNISIGEQGYVDIHVPTGNNMGFTVNTGGHSLNTYDLITESTVTPSTGLANGFYRVAVVSLDTYVAGSATVNYQENYYDYSLNEYDKAGRLIASYQPLGDAINTKPKTEYQYNTLGQLVYTKSPDEGEAWFKYRSDGQIRYSQNSKQKFETNPQEFSYTNYDSYGRPIESGVVESTNFDTIDPDDNSFNTPAGAKKEQQYTTYDVPINTLSCAGPHCTAIAQGGGQTHVNGNVAQTQNDQSTTYYSYDSYGRVRWLVQNITDLGVKTIDYTYDPHTGLVTHVDYQKNTPSERFVHRYTYNEKDQLTLVETSTDGNSFTDLHAEYFYYENGSLRRTELADNVQGVDYVYNLTGQLKGINHPNLNATDDPGGDSDDLFGMQVDYHNADYQRALNNIHTTSYGTDQLNGNIKGIRWNNKQVASQTSVYSYEYDDRTNWLTDALYGTYTGEGSTAEAEVIDANPYTSADGTVTLEATNRIRLTPGFRAHSGSTVIARIVSNNGFQQQGDGDYDVTGIEYDANGNIKKLKRNKDDNGGNAMDDLTYHYTTAPQNGPNRLLYIDDVPDDVAGADDIGDQDPGNYIYNQIGQLVSNTDEGIDYTYNTSGLVTEVSKNNLPLVKFFYNDRNHRVQKDVFDGAGVLQASTFYVRDAAGRAMAIYHKPGGGTTVLTEQTIYGSNRLGIYNKADGSFTYQLTDHLGNVRAVFQKNGANPTNEGYTDYYPFGMAMPNRNSIGSNAYRYAFQGQEKDPETGKEAFELRLWDSRIGRWLTTDPKNGGHSPYWGMNNNPVNLVDPDGGKIVYPGKTGRERRLFRRHLKGLLRSQFANSRDFRSAWRQLKNSPKEYRFHQERSAGKGQFIPTTPDDITKSDLLEMGDDGNWLNPEVAATSPDRAGGDIYIGKEAWNNQNGLAAHVIVEEIMHAVQFDNSVSLSQARAFDYSNYGESFGGNREFEAKMMVGIVNAQSGIPFYKTRNNETGYAQRYGAHFRQHTAGGSSAAKEYFRYLGKWHALAKSQGAYSQTKINSTLPTILKF